MGVSRKEVGAIAGLSDLPEQFGGIDGLRQPFCTGPSTTKYGCGRCTARAKGVRGSYLRRILVYLCLSGSWSTSHLTLIYPSGTAVPFPDDCGDCSLWVNSFWGRLFDERRDSNQSLGAFVFWAVAKNLDGSDGTKGSHKKGEFL